MEAENNFDGKKLITAPSDPDAGNAFITAVNRTGRQAEAKTKTAVLETAPVYGPQILKNHRRLQDLAETLDQRIDAMLKEHKKDFFLAYKTHWFTIQQKFRDVKEMAEREERKTKEDTKIKILEVDLEWFMSEALRLDDLCKGYKKDVDKWKAKAEADDDDRQFLEDQIKAAKRQNKVLRAAVERAQSSAYNVLLHTKDTNLPELPHATKGTKRVTELPHVGRDALLPNEVEQQYLKTIQTLKRQCEQEKQNVRMLKAARANTYNSQSELEEFFLKCIDEARKDVLRRRSQAGNEPPPKNAESEPDKRKVIDILLSSEDVLVFLYEKLFPHRTRVSGSQETQLLPCH